MAQLGSLSKCCRCAYHEETWNDATHKIDVQCFVRQAPGQGCACPVLRPNSQFRTRWDMLVGLLVMVSVVHVPLIVAFEEELIDAGVPIVSMTVFDLSIDSIFMLHIFFQFRTGVVKDGLLHTDQRTIALEYIKTWFAVDLLASFPFDRVHARATSSSRTAPHSVSRLEVQTHSLTVL